MDEWLGQIFQKKGKNHIHHAKKWCNDANSCSVIITGLNTKNMIDYHWAQSTKRSYYMSLRCS